MAKQRNQRRDGDSSSGFLIALVLFTFTVIAAIALPLAIACWAYLEVRYRRIRAQLAGSIITKQEEAARAQAEALIAELDLISEDLCDCRDAQIEDIRQSPQAAGLRLRPNGRFYVADPGARELNAQIGEVVNEYNSEASRLDTHRIQVESARAELTDRVDERLAAVHTECVKYGKPLWALRFGVPACLLAGGVAALIAPSFFGSTDGKPLSELGWTYFGLVMVPGILTGLGAGYGGWIMSTRLLSMTTAPAQTPLIPFPLLPSITGMRGNFAAGGTKTPSIKKLGT